MELKLTGRRCLCRSCNRYFGSVSAFDRHRSGPAHDRKCQDPAEIGMSKNTAGFWIIEPMPKVSKPAFLAFGSRVGGEISNSEGVGKGRDEKGAKVGVGG